MKISDFLTRRELHRTLVYDLLLKPCGLEDTLEVRLRIPAPSRHKVFSFDRGDRDFSARDRAVLDILNPHLVQLYRASEARGRLSEALALHESTEAPVVLLEADDRIAFATTAARQLLDRYFGERGTRLPDSLTSWLRERRRRATGEILDLVAEGRTNSEIAERLWLSSGTVRKHLDNVYAKLGVHTRTAAARFVRKRRLLSQDPPPTA
jgi:DNA-binding CsgD family transcriptional regulator